MKITWNSAYATAPRGLNKSQKKAHERQVHAKRKAYLAATVEKLKLPEGVKTIGNTHCDYPFWYVYHNGHNTHVIRERENGKFTMNRATGGKVGYTPDEPFNRDELVHQINDALLMHIT